MTGRFMRSIALASSIAIVGFTTGCAGSGPSAPHVNTRNLLPSQQMAAPYAVTPVSGNYSPSQMQAFARTDPSSRPRSVAPCAVG